MNSNLSYLAAPYSHQYPEIVIKRIELLMKADLDLTVNHQKITVSPLYKHYMLPYGNIPGDWNYWENYSKALMDQCKELIIVEMDEWKKSTGVLAEIEYAKNTLYIPIFLYNSITKVLTPWS